MSNEKLSQDSIETIISNNNNAKIKTDLYEIEVYHGRRIVLNSVIPSVSPEHAIQDIARSLSIKIAKINGRTPNQLKRERSEGRPEGPAGTRGDDEDAGGPADLKASGKGDRKRNAGTRKRVQDDEPRRDDSGSSESPSGISELQRVERIERPRGLPDERAEEIKS